MYKPQFSERGTPCRCQMPTGFIKQYFFNDVMDILLNGSNYKFYKNNIQISISFLSGFILRKNTLQVFGDFIKSGMPRTEI